MANRVKPWPSACGKMRRRPNQRFVMGGSQALPSRQADGDRRARNVGAGDGIRTHDIQLGKLTLYP
jgi:hypothetical protein